MRLPAFFSRLLWRKSGPTARLTFAVTRVPDGTPASDTLTLGTNLNGWRPDAPGWAFSRDARGRYRLTVEAPNDGMVEFKITRGSWATVERGADGRDLPNRVLHVRGDQVLKLHVDAWADMRPRTGVAGDVRTLERVASPQLRNERTLWVYLPPSYRHDPARRYPVLYLHDGQNVFDPTTAFSGEWGADEAAEALAHDKRLEVIMVAIANNADRMKEYSPFGGAENDHTPLAEPYADFIVKTVKPLIDERFRTLADRAHTGILGSSMGGLISLYAALAHPDTFGFVGAMSPSFWYAGFQMYDWVKARSAPPMRIYIDVGDNEVGESPSGVEGFVRDTFAMGDVLRTRGHEVRVVVGEGADHSEAAWARRFPAALEWFITSG
jgi:pullulanase